jgi:hypothetical protein
LFLRAGFLQTLILPKVVLMKEGGWLPSMTLVLTIAENVVGSKD